MLSDKTIAEIQQNPVPNGEQIASDLLDKSHTFQSEAVYLEMLDRYAFLQILSTAQQWPVVLPDLSISHKAESLSALTKNMGELVAYLRGQNQTTVYSAAKQRYASLVGLGRPYELTDGDIQRIQALINNLRQEINSSTMLEPDHKQRLLARLERLQSEVHKRMSDYDRVYGIMVDSIVLVQRFGESVKPITELIREIGNLFWRSQSRAEQLPGDAVLRLPEGTQPKTLA